MSLDYFCTPIQFGTYSTFTAKTLNAAPSTLMYGYSFIARDTAIDYFWINVRTITATPANVKVTFELQADSGSGAPSGTALASLEVVGGWSAITSRKISVAWSSVTLTVGARYWIVAKNTSTSPTADYPGFGYNNSYALGAMSTSYSMLAQAFNIRTYNGSDWTTAVDNAGASITVVFTNGVIDGALTYTTTLSESDWIIAGTREVGFEFKVPYNSAAFNIAAAGMYIQNPDVLQFKCYINRALVSVSSHNTEITQVSGLVHLPLPVAAYPGDLVSIMALTVTEASTSTGPYGERMVNDPDFTSRRSMGVRRVKVDSGGIWTTDETTIYGSYIFLDPRNPFLPARINRRSYSGR